MRTREGKRKALGRTLKANEIGFFGVALTSKSSKAFYCFLFNFRAGDDVAVFLIVMTPKSGELSRFLWLEKKKKMRAKMEVILGTGSGWIRSRTKQIKSQLSDALNLGLVSCGLGLGGASLLKCFENRLLN